MGVKVHVGSGRTHESRLILMRGKAPEWPWQGIELDLGRNDQVGGVPPT